MDGGGDGYRRKMELEQDREGEGRWRKGFTERDGGNTPRCTINGT